MPLAMTALLDSILRVIANETKLIEAQNLVTRATPKANSSS